MIREEIRTENQCIYWLCRIPGLGPVSMEKMRGHAGTFRNIFYMEGKQFAEAGILTGKQAKAFDAAKEDYRRCAEEYLNLTVQGTEFVTILDEAYPKRLMHIYGPPMGIYVKGRLPADDVPSAAIVGARNCSDYGLRTAHVLGALLGKHGVQVISGMALGVDGAGHQGALSENGSTFAVLGCGVDICYPRSHGRLYREIPGRGGILSEFSLREQPMPSHFPMRNRMISGLADVVIVVEARERSGSLITADLALEQGKDVFAVPGRMTEELSRGCNRLIHQGAEILTSPADLLDYFQIKEKKKLNLHEKMENTLAKEEKIVYSCLDSDPKHIDQIAQQCGLALHTCMTVLFELELRGIVRQPAGHYYARDIYKE